MAISQFSGQVYRKISGRWTFSCLFELSYLSLALLIILLILLPAAISAEDVMEVAKGSRGVLSPIQEGGISVEQVYCPYTQLVQGQSDIPLRVTVSNGSDTDILVQYVYPIFTYGELGDRMGDYSVLNGPLGGVILPQGGYFEFDFEVEVNPSALADENIRIDAYVQGYRLDNMETVSDSTAALPHQWMVLSEAVSVVVGLFDTRLTQQRDDDYPICMHFGESFGLNTIYYLNGGKPLADIEFDGTSYYRLVIQLSPSFDWEYQPNETGKGFLALMELDKSFGRYSAPLPARKELLVTDFFVPDEGNDPADFVVGATRQNSPAVPWDMFSDPWADSLIDVGKTGEYGSLVISPAPLSMIIDCVDGSENWEVTGKCEAQRYYFYETWYQPDFQWSNGDTVDIALSIQGEPSPNNIEELHLLFRFLDDDTLGPVFSDFSPGIIPDGTDFHIMCRISDPSGVYDDETGFGGQGVYLLWDTDGSIIDDSNELQMSSIGGGYYRTDSLIAGQSEGAEVIYQVFACDDDFDGEDPADRSCSKSEEAKVQVVGSYYLVDEPGSLYPSSVYPGHEGVTFIIELDNPVPTYFTLETTSYISFTDGSQTVTAYLGNRTTIYEGANDFPLAFGPIDIPHDFYAPDTLAVVLDLNGTYGGMTAYNQRWTASETNELVTLEPRILFEAHAVPSSSSHPGETGLELLRLEVTNESLGEASIDSIIVRNVTSGWEGGFESDADINSLYLYREGSSSGSGSFDSEEAAPARGDSAAGPLGDYPGEDTGEAMLSSRPFSGGDSLAASAVLASGRATFNLSACRILPAGRSFFYYVVADLDSFLACDGDSLDLEVVSPDSVFVTGGASVSFTQAPLNSEGKSVIDGFMPHQLEIEDILPDTIYSSDSNQPVLAAVIPVNGYAPDILTGLSVKNFGDERADALIECLKLWIDDGDGVFSSGADSLVGTLLDTGDRFEISGIFRPVFKPERLFIAADPAEDFSEELELRFGVPEGGVSFVSGNDGPIGENAIPGFSQLLIRREVIELEALTLTIGAGAVHPGDEGIELLALEISNSTLDLVILDSLRVRGDSALFSCEPSKEVKLYLDDGDVSFDPSGDSLLTSSSWIDGSGLFGGLDFGIASDEMAVLFVSADLDSFKTVDGQVLSVGVESLEDVYLTVKTASLYQIEASFPIISDGAAAADGMMSHQVTLYPYPDSTIVDRIENVMVLDLGIPGNGCLDDTLTGLTVFNLGTAGKHHIDRVILWSDDGDGRFDPELDDNISEFEEISAQTYYAHGLSLPVSGLKRGRLFVTVDLKGNIRSGATIRMGVPSMGIEVASGNDGPIDGDVVMDESLIIPIPDRVTVYTSILGNKRVRLGECDVLNMVLGMYNSYTEPKNLKSIMLLQGGTSLPSELVEVKAFEDSDNDGLFDPLKDKLLETLVSTDILYLFDDLGLTIEPYKSSQLFITYTVASRGVRDSVSVDLLVSSASFIEFEEKVVFIEGDFPMNSAGIDFTDGMISSQVDILLVKGGRVSPGDEDVPCFSFRLPCNGTLSDTLSGLFSQNLGTCMPGQDIEYFRLWREAGGNGGSYDPGLEDFVGFLAWDGSFWSSVSELSEPIDSEGILLHLTADISSTAMDGRTLHLSLPLNAVEVVSGNDGPIDASVKSTAVIMVTTDPLIVSFSSPQSVTRQQEFDVMMSVSNVSDTTLTAVVPDSFSYSGEGSLMVLTGPEPPSIDLPGRSDSSFAWTLQAQSPGAVVFRGRAVESGGVAVSPFELSDTLLVEEIPGDFSVVFGDLSPVSLNRGEEDATIFELSMDYGSSCEGCAAVNFISLDIFITDGSGYPLAVDAVASRISLKDESMLLCSVSTTGVEDSVITLSPESSLLFTPGDSKTIRVAVDVSDSAAAGDFRLHIQEADYLVLEDHNSGDIVQFEGASFPWSTNTVALKDPVSELVVLMNGTMPGYVNRGQEDVEALELVLVSGGGSAAADINVSEITFRTEDDGGDTLEAGDVFRVFRVNDGMGNSHFITESFGGYSSVCCLFQPAVTVSSQIPVSLHVVFDCLNNPLPEGFSIVLEDTIDVVARDVNSGKRVAVRADTVSGRDFPMNSGTAVFLDPLGSVAVSGEGLVPEKLTAGLQDIEALRAVLHHTGHAGESSSSCSGVTVRVLDHAGHGLVPYGFLDAVKASSGGTALGTVYIAQGDTSSNVYVPFSQQLITAPGEEDTIEIQLDIEASAQPGFFQIHVNERGLDVRDLTDSSVVDQVGDFPISSGIAEIVSPAERILFEAEALLPANVAAGDEVGVFGLHFERRDDPGGSNVLVEGLIFEVLDEEGRLLDPSGVMETVRLEDESGEVPSECTFQEGRLCVDFTPPLILGEDESIGIALLVHIARSPSARVFSVRIGSPPDITCSDETTGESVAVDPVPGSSFPFSSGRSALLGRSLESSFYNYPNPFIASREKTTITFYMPGDGTATLKVFTVAGRKVITLLDNEHRGKGLHEDVYWSGNNGRGGAVLNGVYYLVLTAKVEGKEYVLKRKIAVVR